MAVTISETIFDGINFPESLKKIIRMSLEDGILTDREKELIKRKALAEGIDEIEFDFYFEKIEERFTSSYKEQNNPVKALRKAFDSMKELAEGGTGIVPADLTEQLSMIPGIATGAAITGAVSSVLNVFIKTPSNLNTLKSEVIKHFMIPKDIDLIVDFLEYANISIAEEKQRIKAKSGMAGISDFVAGGELDIIPIWKLKKKQVIEKAKEDFKDNADALKRLKKYQSSPTEKLQKLLTTTAGLPVKMSSLFMKVGIPDSAEDLIELMNFVRQMAQSSDPRAPEFREHLLVLQAEGQRKFPEKLAEIESHSIHVSPLQKLKENLKKGTTRVVLGETTIPDHEDEFFEMIRFVEAQSRANINEAIEFKYFLGKMYDHGLKLFPNSRMKLSAYRPHSVDILKHRLAGVTKMSEIGGLAGVLKEIAVGSSKQYKEDVETVLRNFQMPSDFDDLMELLSFVKSIADGNGMGEVNVPFIEFQNRLYTEALRIFPEMTDRIFPYRVSALEKFKLYELTHSLKDAIASFKTPDSEEDFFELIKYAHQMAKFNSFHKEEYKQLQKRLYTDGKGMDIDQNKLKQYKIKTLGIF